MKHQLNPKLNYQLKTLFNFWICCFLLVIFSCEQKNAENIQFNNVENPPVLIPHCDNLSKAQTKECFIDNITELIRIEFNSAVIPYNISTIQKVDVAFTVDKEGVLSNIEINSPFKEVKEEITRLLKTIPKMKPASQNGDNVAVDCAFPVVFTIKF